MTSTNLVTFLDFVYRNSNRGFPIVEYSFFCLNELWEIYKAHKNLYVVIKTVFVVLNDAGIFNGNFVKANFGNFSHIQVN
jgi:hypothetical protein